MSSRNDSICGGGRHTDASGGYTCQDSIDLLRDYLEGEMPADLAAALKSHLDLCPPCVEFVQAYQKTSELCRKALKARMPEGLSARLTSFLHEKLSSKG